VHRLNTIPGGWNPDSDGVIFVEQNPADLVFLTAADSDIQTLAIALDTLPDDFPSIRVVNLLNLQQQLSIDTYAEDVLSHAKIIIIRLLGGRSYWSYGLEVVKEIAVNSDVNLLILPGDDRPDPDLISHSNLSLSIVNQLWQYLLEGGRDNYINALKFIVNICLSKNYIHEKPIKISRVGLYSNFYQDLYDFPKVGILFYRAHYLSVNTSIIDAICQELIKRNLQPVPLFVSSLKDVEIQEEVLRYFKGDDSSIQVLLNTTSFSISSPLSADVYPLLSLNVPVFQVILSSGTKSQWENDFKGLSPRDMAMNVALPEVDGRIITRAVSFKSVLNKNNVLETDVIVYEPVSDRINFVVDLAANYVKLRQKPNNQKKVALILANYPTRDGRIANGVGLDTPASCIEILKGLREHGYNINDIPDSGDELIKRLISGFTNDIEGRDFKQINHVVSRDEYQEYFASLPEEVQKAIIKRWGDIPENPFIPIAGILLGNIFVGIQPSRGYDLDPSLNYHAPDLEPTHEYLAFYYWLRTKLEIDAIAHIGKHGNLEWLPGKSIALSDKCYPEITLGTIPHFYPFIVNDPGEGSQAKRRSQAVIIDHLTPPLTRAELYGSMQRLEGLIDEYYEAQTLDPTRLSMIEEKITDLIKKEHLERELGLDNINSPIYELLNQADGYLCELKEAQIRDGLHIFGQCPEQRQLRDLILAIARIPSQNHKGLTRAIAEDFCLEIDPLTTDFSHIFETNKNIPEKWQERLKFCRIVGDVIAILEEYAIALVEELMINRHGYKDINIYLDKIQQNHLIGEQAKKELQWIDYDLINKLEQTSQEITNLLTGLDGYFVPSGSSGSPTRGRPDVLPTGRNFYSVDIRAIPTETAWDLGRKAAENLIERYTQENGEYPQTLGLSVWGTSTMRTGGDDIAEALALLGVKPVWEYSSRRVIDFEILPLAILGRPRVDVTLRISGFFRDAFPNLIDLFAKVVEAVSLLNEPEDQNPLAKNVQKEAEKWQELGLTETQAKERSQYRIFGSKPGAYGAGLQGLIESQNWQSDEDLAQAYINWSCYAYNKNNYGENQPEVFAHRLTQMQIVLQNQDNREHDLLDSDDYYQFQGGLTASIRSLTGKNPTTYFGDHSRIENPRIKTLNEEIAKVYRSRVINPKWLQGVMRHGYKGAFEMSATVDYLFAYDATANCVEDFMYQGIAENYVFNPEIQNFLNKKNPHALRDISERLLEANQRNLWENVEQKVIEKLQAIALEAELSIEGLNYQET
jgi:cobaltochelatase CobN